MTMTLGLLKASRSFDVIAGSRELLLAVPDERLDIYAMHQLVWSEVVKAASSYGRPPHFLYRQEGSLIRVRSCDFHARQAQPVRWRNEALTHLDLVAVVRAGGAERPVPLSQLEDWCTDKLVQAGFSVSSIAVQPNTRLGFKTDRNTGQKMIIELPVAQIEAQLKIVDRVMCNQALSNGIGRGRRFGMGMICQSSLASR